MAPQQDRRCPKCKMNMMVFKGQRKTSGDGRAFELLLVCASCSHEEWQKFPDPLKIWMD
jgi:DNA-directed RNA polymerase subunit M/transcription elongation factor TFIIS